MKKHNILIIKNYNKIFHMRSHSDKRFQVFVEYFKVKILFKIIN